MRMKTFCMVTLLFCCLAAQAQAQAQGMNEILHEISSNNLTLKAMQHNVEARGQVAMAGASLPAPEIQAGYMFGLDDLHKTTLTASQSFDAASLNNSRRNTARQEGVLGSLELQILKRDILTQARKLVHEIIFRNALIEEYSLRVSHAQALEEACAKGLENGLFSVVDYRKAAVNAVDVKSKAELLEIERRALLTELANLNAGKEIAVTALVNEDMLLPASFEEWAERARENNSSLCYARNSTIRSEQQLKLSKSEALPSFSLGYSSEVVRGLDEFRGVTVGLSIPLWSSGKKVSGAKEQLEAAILTEKDAVMQFNVSARAIYEKAQNLAETMTELQAIIRSSDSIKELDKALMEGELSVHEYITEITYFYDEKQHALEAERDYMLTLAELHSFEM